MRGTDANYAVKRGPEPPPRGFVKRWTRTEYEHLVEIGVFTEEDRLELVNGYIINRMSHKPPHSVSLGLAKRVLTRLLSDEQELLVQLPLALGESSEPEPDLAVVPGNPRDYLEGHPTSALLVVEVAHSTLTLDRGAKSDMYAEAGIPEYWIINLRDDHLEVRRKPIGAHYQDRQILKRGERISPLFLPNAAIDVSDLLP